MSKIKITGYTAIKVATIEGRVLCKHADPTEDARDDLSVDEAREVAAQDPTLIYLVLSKGDVVARLRAKNYEDHDDCLAAACEDVACDLGLETWQLVADWDDEQERRAIVVTTSG